MFLSRRQIELIAEIIAQLDRFNLTKKDVIVAFAKNMHFANTSVTQEQFEKMCDMRYAA